jgi:hypothetical protein
MTFESCQEIGSDEICRRFEEQYNDLAYSSRGFTEEVLKSVDSDNRRRTWALIRIHGHQLGDVLLPWHTSKVDAQRYAVVPPSGMLLSEVVGELHTRIKNNAPMFVERLSTWVDGPLGSIFLSEFIPILSDPTYSAMKPRKGHPVCLDGLHRLIALGKSGFPNREVELVVALGAASL